MVLFSVSHNSLFDLLFRLLGSYLRAQIPLTAYNFDHYLRTFLSWNITKKKSKGEVKKDVVDKKNEKRKKERRLW